METSKALITFISFFNFDKSASEKGLFDSKYWTLLPNLLTNKGLKTNWIHLHIRDGKKQDSRNDLKTIRNLNKNSNSLQMHVMLFSFLNLKVVFKVLEDWRILQSTCRNLDKKFTNDPKLNHLWPLLKNDWENSISGPNAMNNLHYIDFLKKL